MENLQAVINATYPIAFLTAVFLAALAGAVFRKDVAVSGVHGIACLICFTGLGWWGLAAEPMSQPAVFSASKVPTIEELDRRANEAALKLVAAHYVENMRRDRDAWTNAPADDGGRTADQGGRLLRASVTCGSDVDGF